MNVVLNIIYFFLALTVLVSIHEAGHLSMAKLFNVYCEEYSIGFGPKIYQHVPKGVNKKGKPRETKFTIRVLPLGGYVSMAGEGMEDMEEMAKLPKERFLTGIKKWKRAIIMVAGVTLNALVGLILLIVAFSIVPIVDQNRTSFNVSEKVTYTPYNEKAITEDAIAYTNGLRGNMDIKSVKITYTGNVINAKGEDVTTLEKTYLVGKDDVSNGTTSIYGVLNDNFNVYLPKDISATKTFKFTTVDGQEINVTTSPYVYKVDKEGKETFNWKYIGISNHTTNRGFGRVMKDSFETFGEYSIALYKALGQIFTKQGFEQLGGPIAIVQQQMTFSNQGFGQFLLFWGLISINLAIINLLPFPGLDGWHFLVVIVEGITRKEISQKFKAIMSTIGMILLFGLMIAITFKDVFRLFIK